MALDNIPTLGPGSLNSNLDKVLVYKNGGSEVAVSLLTLTNSALNLSGVYLDTVNGRMGIGTPSPTGTLTVKGIGTTSSTTALSVQNSAGTTAFTIKDNGVTNATYMEGGMCWFNNVNSNGIVKFGSSMSVGFNTDPIATAQIKGSGSTSATTSLLVQNSSGTELFKVKDNGETSLNGNLVITSSAFSGNLLFQCIGNNQQQIRGAYGESIYFGRGGNTLELTATEVYVSNNFYGPAMGLNTGGALFGQLSSPVASAQVEIRTTTKGFLPPRMTTAQKNAIATPAAGLMVYDTDLNRPCFYNGTSWITL